MDRMWLANTRQQSPFNRPSGAQARRNARRRHLCGTPTNAMCMPKISCDMLCSKPTSYAGMNRPATILQAAISSSTKANS
eukprot:187300-Chlamydomonas_euryale.AAC.1